MVFRDRIIGSTVLREDVPLGNLARAYSDAGDTAAGDRALRLGVTIFRDIGYDIDEARALAEARDPRLMLSPG